MVVGSLISKLKKILKLRHSSLLTALGSLLLLPVLVEHRFRRVALRYR